MVYQRIESTLSGKRVQRVSHWITNRTNPFLILVAYNGMRCPRGQMVTVVELNSLDSHSLRHVGGFTRCPPVIDGQFKQVRPKHITAYRNNTNILFGIKRSTIYIT